MTVSAVNPTVNYMLDGTSLAFPVPFRYLDPTDLRVMRFDTEGNKTVLAYGADWGASDGNGGSGTVNLTSAGTSGHTLRIRRVTVRTQQTDYETNDTFPAETHEAALDRLMLQQQEQDVGLTDLEARALVAPDGRAGAQFIRDGLGDGDLLQFFGNAIRKFSTAAFAGMFFAGAAVTGHPVPSAGTGGGDTALRGDLANGPAGSNLVAYLRGGTATNAISRNLRELVAETVLASEWGVSGDNAATVTLDDGTVITMLQACQNVLDEAPLGCEVIWPAGPINAGAGPLNQTRWMSHRFARGTDFRFTKTTLDDTAGWRINVAKDIDLGVTENRAMVFLGNGGRIWNYTPGVGANAGGNFALTIGDGWNETDASGADYCANIGCDFYDLRLGGGKINALYVTGPDPYELTPGVSYPETHFQRFHRCTFDGGVYDDSSDGNQFIDCHFIGDEFCAYTCDKVQGAYCTDIVGGTSNCGKGFLHIINGDMVRAWRTQVEHAYAYGDSSAPYGAMVIVQGLDRPVTRCGLYGVNLGAGDRITNTIAIENARHFVIEDVQFGPPKLVGGGGADIYLGDNAFYTHLVRPQNRGPLVGAGGDLRVEQGRGQLTDASRRLVIASQSHPHRNPHYGIWLQIGAIMADPDSADDGELFDTWAPRATEGFEAMLDADTGRVSLAGGLESGSYGGDVCTFPKWMRPLATVRVPVCSIGNVVSRPISSAGTLGDGGALLDQNIFLDGAGWQVPTETNYYAGIY